MAAAAAALPCVILLLEKLTARSSSGEIQGKTLVSEVVRVGLDLVDEVRLW